MHPPGLSETPAPLRPARLWLLAVASLALAVVVEALCAVGLAQSETIGNAIGFSYAIYIQMTASILWIHAVLSGVAPAVLADGSRAFRCGLIAAHVLVGWGIQIGGYAALLPFDAEMVGELAGGALMATLGMFAGLWGALVLLATLCGWTLTRRVDDARRPTFSVGGMMVATAAAALLFASPRVLTPFVSSAVESIYEYWVVSDRWPGTVVSVDSDLDGAAILVMPLVIGSLLATSLASAMWIVRSRWGWLGVTLASLTAASLVLVGEALSGSPIGRVGTAVVVLLSFLIGSLLATLQIAIWQRFGWRLIRIRRGAPAGRDTVPVQAGDSELEHRPGVP